jgi:regulator of RNase E activity RraA
MRFVPSREDLATPASWSSPTSTRAAIEAIPMGAVVVADAMGVRDAGIFGDILCARMAKRQVAALVTDGVVRDLAGVRGTGLPVWCQGGAAPPAVASLTFVGWQEPIDTCRARRPPRWPTSRRHDWGAGRVRSSRTGCGDAPA